MRMFRLFTNQSSTCRASSVLANSRTTMLTSGRRPIITSCPCQKEKGGGHGKGGRREGGERGGEGRERGREMKEMEGRG